MNGLLGLQLLLGFIFSSVTLPDNKNGIG